MPARSFGAVSRRCITLALVVGLGAGVAAIYGFPIMVNDAVLYESNIDTKSPQYRGPINRIISTARVYTPADTSVVTPNSDTP